MVQYTPSMLKRVSSGPEEKAQRLRALAALTKDLGFFLSPTWQLTSICNFRPRGSEALFWFQWLCMLRVQPSDKTPMHIKQKQK